MFWLIWIAGWVKPVLNSSQLIVKSFSDSFPRIQLIFWYTRSLWPGPPYGLSVWSILSLYQKIKIIVGAFDYWFLNCKKWIWRVWGICLPLCICNYSSICLGIWYIGLPLRRHGRWRMLHCREFSTAPITALLVAPTISFLVVCQASPTTAPTISLLVGPIIAPLRILRELCQQLLNLYREHPSKLEKEDKNEEDNKEEDNKKKDNEEDNNEWEVRKKGLNIVIWLRGNYYVC
jgi:hypothetical protein